MLLEPTTFHTESRGSSATQDSISTVDNNISTVVITEILILESV